MPEIVVDPFTRADSTTLGANWTKLTAFDDVRITSNEAKGQTADVVHLDRYTGAGWTGSNTDQYAEVVLGTVGGDVNNCGPGVRASSDDDCYVMACQGAQGSVLYECVNGTFTSIATDLTTTVSGETWRLEVVGTGLTVKRDGVTEFGVTNSAVASGLPCVFAYTNLSATAASWAAGDFAAGGDPALSVLIGEPIVGSSIF